MSDRPILFSSPMVRALLDGRKTQTRRVLKPQIVRHVGDVPAFSWGKFGGLYPDDWFGYGNEIDGALPYRSGDRLWVRETFCDPEEDRRPVYRADYTPEEDRESERINRICRGLKGISQPWKPGIHMPRWTSRLTLTVTDVRVQRLQEISTADALLEGVDIGLVGGKITKPNTRDSYRQLWNFINAARGFGWEANPWIVAVTFTVEQRNIDQKEAA